MVHAVKIETEYFDKMLSGSKPYEIRKNDRDYRKGDVLALNEYNGGYTGRHILVHIESVDEYPEFCKDGYVILVISPLSSISCNSFMFNGESNRHERRD